MILPPYNSHFFRNASICSFVMLCAQPLKRSTLSRIGTGECTTNTGLLEFPPTPTWARLIASHLDILCFRLFRFRYRLREYLRNETSGLLPQLFDYFRVLQILQNFALRLLNDALESLFGSTDLLVEPTASIFKVFLDCDLIVWIFGKFAPYHVP